MLCVRKAEVEACQQEDRLLKRFFRDNEYFPTSRPVANVSDTVLVYFAVIDWETFELVSNLSLIVLRGISTTAALRCAALRCDSPR